jgi:hypothetical protein
MIDGSSELRRQLSSAKTIKRRLSVQGITTWQDAD